MPKYVNARKIADEYGFTVGQMKQWRSRNQGPVYKIINGRAYYRVDDFERWLREQDQKYRL